MYLNVHERGFEEFIRTIAIENPLKAEYLLPTMIGEMLRDRKCTVSLLPTHDTWYVMTYK